MKYKTVKRKLLRYLDNELPEDEFKAVRQHLSSCPECRNYLKQLEKIWLTEQPVTPIEVPPFLWTRLSVRLESESQAPFAKRFFTTMSLFIKKALIPAAIVITIFVGSKFGSLLSPQNNTQNKTYSYSESLRDEFGMSYFDAVPQSTIAKDLFVAQSNDKGF